MGKTASWPALGRIVQAMSGKAGRRKDMRSFKIRIVHRFNWTVNVDWAASVWQGRAADGECHAAPPPLAGLARACHRLYAAPAPAPLAAGAAPAAQPQTSLAAWQPSLPGDAFGEEVTMTEKTIIYFTGSGIWDTAFETIVDSFKTVYALPRQAGHQAGRPADDHLHRDRRHRLPVPGRGAGRGGARPIRRRATSRSASRRPARR